MNIDTSTPARRAMHRPATLIQPCGKCPTCQAKKPRECIRLQLAVFRTQKYGCAINDPNCPGDEDCHHIVSKPQSEPVSGMAFPEPQRPVGGSLMPAAMSDSGNEPLLAFFVTCDPTGSTAQQKGVRIVNGKPMFFTKAKVKKAEQQIARLFTPYALSTSTVGALSVEMEFIYPWRKGEKRSITEKFSRIPKDTKVDVDNAAKVCLDQMTKLRFFEDDAQIACLILRKFWGDTPGIRVNISRANPVPR